MGSSSRACTPQDTPPEEMCRIVASGVVKQWVSGASPPQLPVGAKSHLYPDEWLSMFFLTLIFLLVCIFELEYERKQKGISANTQTTFIRLSVTYTVSGGLIYAISYLPEFYRPVMIPVILLTAVSNSMVAVSFGLFFDLVLALTVGGSFYALAAYMMLTMLAAVLAQALKEKKNTVWVYPF